MPHPRWRNIRANVPRKRNTGLGGADTDYAHDETERRLEDPIAQAIAKTPEAGGGGSNPGSSPLQPAPTAPSGPDRRHKSSGASVYIMKDHLGSEGESPTNGGYRSSYATASSINDGYGKARAIKSMLTPEARVTLVIEGGLWAEDLFLSTEGIDIEGVGSVAIDGAWTVSPQIETLRLANLSMRSTKGGVPLTLAQGADLPTDNEKRSPIVLDRLDIRGKVQALISKRRIYAVHCTFMKLSPSLASLTPPEVAAAEVYLSPGDYDFSEFEECTIYANPAPNFPAIEYYPGFALKVSARIFLPTMPEGGYLPAIGPRAKTITAGNAILANLGVKLTRCNIYGSLLTEACTVSHTMCEAYGGVILDTRAGGVYAITRGWAMDDGLTFQPAYVTFDLSKVHAAAIARGTADPLQAASAWKRGGIVAFIHSVHKGYYDGAYPSAMSSPGGAPCEIYTVKSSTPSSTFRGLSVLGTDTDSQVGVPALAVADPYLP